MLYTAPHLYKATPTEVASTIGTNRNAWLRMGPNIPSKAVRALDSRLLAVGGSL